MPLMIYFDKPLLFMNNYCFMVEIQLRFVPYTFAKNGYRERLYEKNCGDSGI